MIRNHNEKKMAEIDGIIEKWQIKKGYSQPEWWDDLWNKLFDSNLSDPQIINVTKEIGITPEQFRDWYFWYLRNASGCGSF